jgi:phage gp36-like protein
MAFLSQEELKTHLYAENINVISRDDETILQAAIDAACQEAKSYLAAYNTTEIFAAVGSDRNALLLIFIKDIAVWHFINLCNAGTELQLRQDRYERAIDWLKAVQRGDVSPDLPKIIEDGKEKNGIITFGSNPKKNQHF